MKIKITYSTNEETAAAAVAVAVRSALTPRKLKTKQSDKYLPYKHIYIETNTLDKHTEQ